MPRTLNGRGVSELYLAVKQDSPASTYISRAECSYVLHCRIKEFSYGEGKGE